MKSLLIAALFLAASVTAQTQCDASASAIPTCGQPCLRDAGDAVGCQEGDYRCSCASASAIQSRAQGCVLNACGIQTGLAVQASASALCACVTSVGTAPPPTATPTPTDAPSEPPTEPSSPTPTATGSPDPTTLATSVQPPPASCEAVTVTQITTVTVGQPGPTGAPPSGDNGGAGCKGKEGVEYLLCCVNKIFTSGTK